MLLKKLSSRLAEHSGLRIRPFAARAQRRQAMHSVLGSSGPMSANTWTSIDVTSYITGNGSFNLALTTNSSTAMSFSSRQGANLPQLVIETQNGPTLTG